MALRCVPTCSTRILRTMTFKPANLCWAVLLAAGCHAHAENLCTWEVAAARYGVSPHVLYAIAAQESGLNPRAVHQNEDGSQDIGLTQINSKWLPHLNKLGVTQENLSNPCINMHVGAYILSLQMIKHGNTWDAVGAYHSRTPALRDQYARTIHRRVQAMLQSGSGGTKG